MDCVENVSANACYHSHYTAFPNMWQWLVYNNVQILNLSHNNVQINSESFVHLYKIVFKCLLVCYNNIQFILQIFIIRYQFIFINYTDTLCGYAMQCMSYLTRVSVSVFDESMFSFLWQNLSHNCELNIALSNGE